MTRAILSVCLLLVCAACQNVNRVVFVTDTEIGIGADSMTQKATIGYDRNVLVIGPDFIKDGQKPPVVARLKSNLNVFNPKISQFYATGKAALIASRRMETPAACAYAARPDAPPAVKCACNEGCEGDRRISFFGTSSHLGLSVDFGQGMTAPTMHFGYKRREFSLLPLTDAPAPAFYPSTLASIATETDAGGVSGAGGTPAADPAPAPAGKPIEKTGMRINEFFATGGAAEALAYSDEIRGILDILAKQAALQQITDGTASEALKDAYVEGVTQMKRDRAQIGDLVAKITMRSAGEGDFTAAEKARVAEVVDRADIDEAWKTKLKAAKSPRELSGALSISPDIRARVSKAADNH